MAKKPNYEELEQKIKELEKLDFERGRVKVVNMQVKNEWEFTFNAVPDLIMILDDQHRIVRVNEAMADKLGVSPDEAVGLICYEHVHGTEEPPPFCPHNKMLEDGKKHMEEVHEERLGGDFLVNVSPVHDMEGHLFGSVHVVRDITERKQAQAELKRYQDHLEQLVAERTKSLQKVNEELHEEISERKRAEEALRTSEEKYSKLFEVTPVPIVVINNTGEIIDINNSHLKKVGGGKAAKEDYIGMNILTHPSVEKARVSEIYEKALEGESIEAEQVYYPEVTRGTEGYFEVKASPVYDKNGDISSIIITHEEVTERKLAEDLLRESNEKYRNIFENVAVSIILIDANGQIVDINPYHITNVGKGQVSKETLLGHNLFTHPTIVSAGISEELKRVLEGKLVNITEHYYPTTSGGVPCYFNTRAVPLFADGEVASAVIMCEDITEIKSSEELIRELSHQLIKSQENERLLISQELHDQVAQDLSALKINCEMLSKHKSLSPEIRNDISGMSDKFSKILKAVRDLSYDLRPPGLEKLGLVETINRYCKEFSRDNGVNIEFFSAGVDNLRLEFETNINLYRMVQEGLNNIRKHADANNVNIKLISSFPNIILRIEDDGKGFDTEERLIIAYKEKRMGIRSMKERVGLLQGKMRIESIPGKGTQVVFEIPYKDENIGE